MKVWLVMIRNNGVTSVYDVAGSEGKAREIVDAAIYKYGRTMFHFDIEERRVLA